MTKIPLNTFTYWLLSILISVLAIVVMGYKWHSVKPNPVKMDDEKTSISIINTEQELNTFLESCETVEFADKTKPPIRIPVGFFIQSFSFVNANEVNFVGYIWMKFPKEYTDKGYKKEFIFPEEVHSNTTKTREIYEVQLDDSTLKGWYFDVIVRQKFDYSGYPLDYQDIWLRIWLTEFEHYKDMIIVPDFDSYVPDVLGEGIFALDRDIVPSGWKINSTFYSIKTQSYGTSFGFRIKPTCLDYSELYYNIKIHRKKIDALITDLVPLFFTTLLLFALLMSVSNEPEKKERFGFNTTNTIAICASLLFIVVLLHIQIRRQFVGSELVYIEYFYIITYLMILFTTLNSYAITVDRHRTLAFLFWRDNLLPKIAYWPFLLWMMAVITLIII